MKKIFIVGALIIFSNVYTQNDNRKVIYTDGVMDMTLIDKDGNEFTKPYGVDVEVIYDSFFKSYKIYFMNELNEYSKFMFTYIRDNNESSILVKSHTGDLSSLFDLLETKKMLIIANENERYMSFFVIEKLKRIN